MLRWKLRKRQILPVNQNLSSKHFLLAKFQLVRCKLSLAMIWQMTYHKILKISLGALYFSKILFEGLIFRGAYLWREICVSKSIWLVLQLEVNLPFLLCFTLYLKGQFSKYKLPGGLYLEGRFNRGFLHYWFGGLIFGGAYFQNFTVFDTKKKNNRYVFFWEMDFVKGPVDEFVTSCRFLSGIASSHLTLIPSHPQQIQVS